MAPFPGNAWLDSADHEDVAPESQILHPYWTQRTCKALSLLAEFPALEQLIREYYGLSQGAVIAAPLILNALGPFRDMSDGLVARDLDGNLELLTTRVIQNTSQTFTVAPTLEGRDFHTLFTGLHTRLEIVGILYSIAGRASLLGLLSDKFNTPQRSIRPRTEFAQKMLEASDTALQVCKKLTPVNDLTVWLLHESLLLTIMVHGDSSQSFHSSVVPRSNQTRFEYVESPGRAVDRYLFTWNPQRPRRRRVKRHAVLSGGIPPKTLRRCLPAGQEYRNVPG